MATSWVGSERGRRFGYLSEMRGNEYKLKWCCWECFGGFFFPSLVFCTALTGPLIYFCVKRCWMLAQRWSGTQQFHCSASRVPFTYCMMNNFPPVFSHGQHFFQRFTGGLVGKSESESESESTLSPLWVHARKLNMLLYTTHWLKT